MQLRSDFAVFSEYCLIGKVNWSDSLTAARIADRVQGQQGGTWSRGACLQANCCTCSRQESALNVDSRCPLPRQLLTRKEHPIVPASQLDTWLRSSLPRRLCT